MRLYSKRTSISNFASASVAVDLPLNPLAYIDEYGAGSLQSFLSQRSPNTQPWVDDRAAQMSYWNTPNSKFGGASPKEAKALFEEFNGIELASNSLYLIEIKDLSPSAQLPNGVGNNTRAFQLLTTSLSYTPISIPAEKQNVGSAVIDSVNHTEHVELSLTTYDDKYGTLKRYFDEKAGKVVNRDGTVGLPVDFLLKVRILHAFFSDATNKGGYERSFLMRPLSIEHSLSRADGGKQELPIRFTEYDTYLDA